MRKRLDFRPYRPSRSGDRSRIISAFSKWTIVLCSLLVSSTVYAGPFGIGEGDSIGVVGGMTNGGMSYRSLPKKRLPPGFHSVTVYGTKGTGACIIKAFLVRKNVDSYGVEARELANDISERLERKYGKPSENFSFLRHGSLWKNPEDWMMGLYRKERKHHTFWILKSPINEVHSISLELIAPSPDSVLAIIKYEFGNVERCIKEARRNIDKDL